MREVMWRNQLKHQHLMESLRRSGDKKKVEITSQNKTFILEV